MRGISVEEAEILSGTGADPGTPAMRKTPDGVAIDP
jgi:hypothetical protein